MPLHPPERDYAATLKEDRDAAILADSLGYAEAFFGEHATDPSETITSSLMFVASLANVTQRMKLACGTVNLPNTHPAHVATQVAMLDHMLEGRFIMGISAGALLSDAEVFGSLDSDRGAMFLECIDQVLAIWANNPPYDIEGAFWNISTRRTLDEETGLGVMPKPYQRPHPEIVCPAIAPFPAGVSAAAQRGWHPLSSNFLQAPWVNSHWRKYVEGCEAGGLEARPADWRVARSIFVADDRAEALRYGKSDVGPYWYQVEQIYKKLRKAGRLSVFKESKDQLDGEITVPYAVDRLVIAGTPDDVVSQILEFRESAGEFGTLIYTGVDWQNEALGRRSLELMATEVLPRLNGELGA